jgi:hypothetical protein
MPNVRFLLLLTLVVALLSVVVSGIAVGQEATPLAMETPETGATPATSPSDSPEATPQYTVQECADFEDSQNRLFAAIADLTVALIEARQITPTANELPSTDRLTPEAAREVAGIIDEDLPELAAVDVAPVAQEFRDANNASLAVIATGLRDYADAVEGGANRDQTIVDLLFGTDDFQEATARQNQIAGDFEAACYPGVAEDAAERREIAGLIEEAIAAQSDAKVPRVERAANDALIEALEAIDAEAIWYADRIEAGEDRFAVTEGVEARLLPTTIAATDEIRDLFERCGIPIGITESDDGNPQLSRGQCKQAFDWYEATAERFAELNATDFPFLALGLTLPGGLGAVDLDALNAQAEG